MAATQRTGRSRRPIDMSAERWARALADTAPSGVRLLLRLAVLVQRRLLGLRLEPRPSASHLLGWRLADHGDHWFRLEADSPWLGTAHLVFLRDEGQVSVATFLRYRRRIAALVWAPVSLLHGLVGLVILRHVVTAPSMTAAREVVRPIASDKRVSGQAI